MRVRVALCVFLVSAPVIAAPRVLLCAADSPANTTIVRSDLVASGAFATVDVTDCNTGTPTVATLRTYDAVLVWSSSGFQNRASLGDNLADYVEGGGSVVAMMYALYTSFDPLGRWASGGYACLLTGSFLSGQVSLAAAPNEPGPLTAGVTSVTANGARSAGVLNAARGAVSVWSWADGNPALCRMSISSGRSLAFNAYYPNTFGNRDELLRNALLFAAGAAGPLVPLPLSVAFADTGVGTTPAGTSVTFTNTSSSAVTVTAISLAGSQPGDFSITNPPSLPLSVASMAPFSATVAFAPTATGMRSGVLRVAVMGQTTPIDVPLRGTGTGPLVVITPNPVRLGSTGVGVPVQVDVTVANQGAPVTVTSAAITLGAVEFSLGAGPTYPVVLGTAAQFVQTIAFTATQTGLRTGELTVSTNDPMRPIIRVPLLGTSGPPALTIDVGTVVLPTTNVGATSAPQQVTLTNTGFSALDVSSVLLNGANAADFMLDPMGFPATLAPGANGKISVSFAPAMTGLRTAAVAISSNDPNTPMRTINLSGTATQAVLGVSPATVSFGNVRVGTQSMAQMVTVSNAGTGTLRVLAWGVSGAPASSFPVSGPVPPLSLTAGSASTVSVSCAPPDAGAMSASFDVGSDVGMRSVPISCTGVVPAGDVTPAVVDFGEVAVGIASTPRSITVANTGVIDLAVTAISLGGPDAGFHLTNASPMTVSAGGSLVFSAVFEPGVEGPATAAVDVVTDDAQSPTRRVTLSGSGVTLRLEAQPDSVDFGRVLVGSDAGRTVTLANTGTGTLTVSALAFLGTSAPRFSTSAVAPIRLDAGASTAVALTYAPTAVATDLAILSVSASGLSPVAIALGGSGVTTLGSGGGAGGGTAGGSGGAGGGAGAAGGGANGGGSAGGLASGGGAGGGGGAQGGGGCGCDGSPSASVALGLLALLRRRRDP